MKTALSHRARVWILMLLLAGGGVVLAILWVFLPQHQAPEPGPEANVDRPEPVAVPVAETPRAQTRPAETGSFPSSPEVAKLGMPSPRPIPAAPTGADASVANENVANRMRGILNFVSGVVSTSTGTTTTK